MTAYRYFANQRALLLTVSPSIARSSQLPDDVGQRLDLVVREQLRIIRRWEPQLRTALRLSLDQPPQTSRERRPRCIRAGWIEDALAPLAVTHLHVDRRRLAVAIRAGCGSEARVWMVDIADVPRKTAATLMRESAQAPSQGRYRGVNKPNCGLHDRARPPLNKLTTGRPRSD